MNSGQIFFEGSVRKTKRIYHIGDVQLAKLGNLGNTRIVLLRVILSPNEPQCPGAEVALSFDKAFFHSGK